jgi:hypothetical protein
MVVLVVVQENLQLLLQELALLVKVMLVELLIITNIILVVAVVPHKKDADQTLVETGEETVVMGFLRL